MSVRKKTLRRLPLTARKVKRLASDLKNLAARLDKLVPEIERFGHDSRLLKTARNNPNIVIDDDIFRERPAPPENALDDTENAKRFHVAVENARRAA